MRYAQLIMGPAGSGKVGELIYWTYEQQTMRANIARLQTKKGAFQLLSELLN